MDELKDLNDRRALLQEHWSELFGRIQDIEFTYPFDIRFGGTNADRERRSYMTPEDLEEVFDLEEGMRSVDVEKNELDKEILKMRFKLGLAYLTEVNRMKQIAWKLTNEHVPNSEDQYDILYVKEWRAMVGDNIVRVTMIGENIPSFIKGMEHVARHIGDTGTLEALRKWPEERQREFNEIDLEFAIVSRSSSKTDKDFAPGLRLKKTFDTYTEVRDWIDVQLPLSFGAYAFPTIESEERTRAEQEMITLGRSLGVESL